MPTSSQAVLPDVSQIFPGLQQIPLGRIRPNPDNPGPPISQSDIQDMAENILAVGLKNEIKLMVDKSDPLAPGVTPHPDNPRLRADGKPWEAGDFNWMILSGERRWRAFGLLQTQGWFWLGPPSPGHEPPYRLSQKEGQPKAAIPAYILNPTPGEAVEITHLDNDIRDRGWWASYQSIENRIKADPGLTQAQVATRLKLAVPVVNQAIRLLPLLNADARALIITNGNNSNKGNKGISESAAFQLVALGPGTGLKRGVRKAGEEAQKLWPYPVIPPETQDLVRRTLAVAIDRGMTQAGVKGLVAWVKAGNAPEDFGTQPALKAKETPVSPIPMPLGALGAAPSAPAASAGAGMQPTGEGFKEAVVAASAWVRKHGPGLLRSRSSQPHPTRTPGIIRLARGLGRVVHWLRQPLQTALRNELKRAARWAVALALLWLAYWAIQWGFGVWGARQATVPLPVKEALARPAAQPVTHLISQTPNREASANQVISRPADSSQAVSVKNRSGAPANGEPPWVIAAQPTKVAGPVTVTAAATPAVQPTKTQGDDLGKKLGDGVRDISDAANKANNAASSVDKVKNLLGL